MKASCALATLLVAALSSAALGAPCAVYSPATGNIKLTNDTGFVLPAILLKSGSPGLGQLPLGSSLSGVALPVPGAVLDTGDQPAAITYTRPNLN